MNTTLNITTVKGGILYFLQNFPVYLPYLTMISIGAVLDSIGNVLFIINQRLK